MQATGGLRALVGATTVKLSYLATLSGPDTEPVEPVSAGQTFWVSSPVSTS
jgi:hypothetical protein